jgi:hypothetical protein
MGKLFASPSKNFLIWFPNGKYNTELFAEGVHETLEKNNKQCTWGPGGRYA